MVDDVLDKIQSAGYKYQYVNSYKHDRAQLIDIEDTLDGFKEDSGRPIPTIKVLKALEFAINSKL